MKSGVFITFEGPEGVGKTTQIRRLEAHLTSAGHQVMLTREPGGTSAGEALRELLLSPEMAWTPLAEALLMNAARDAHLQERVLPALAQNQIVLCDRFALSTRAYQGGGGGVDDEFLKTLEDNVCLRTPDLTLVFDLPAEEGLARAAARGAADRFEAKPQTYHTALRSKFLELARAHDFPIVDASGTEDEVGARVINAIQHRLPSLLGQAQ